MAGELLAVLDFLLRKDFISTSQKFNSKQTTGLAKRWSRITVMAGSLAGFYFPLSSPSRSQESWALVLGSWKICFSFISETISVCSSFLFFLIEISIVG